MLHSPAPDVAVGPIIAIYLIMGLAILGFIVLIEATVLKLLKWKNFWPGLLASLIANLVSTAAGFGLTVVGWDYSGVMLFLFFYTSSALIEGVILWLFKRNLRETIIATLVMNAASYLLIVLPAFASLSIL